MSMVPQVLYHLFCGRCQKGVFAHTVWLDATGRVYAAALNCGHPFDPEAKL